MCMSQFSYTASVIRFCGHSALMDIRSTNINVLHFPHIAVCVVWSCEAFLTLTLCTLPSLPSLSQASGCSGTQVPTSWGRPWRGTTGAASATDLQLRMGSTMTCCWRDGRSPPWTLTSLTRSSGALSKRNSLLCSWRWAKRSYWRCLRCAGV